MARVAPAGGGGAAAAAGGAAPRALRAGDRVIAKYVLTASPVKLQAWYDNLDSYRDMAQP